MGKTSRWRENLVSALDVPGDVGLGDAVITITGPRQAVVENYRRILSCTDKELVLLTGRGKVTFRGERLLLIYYTPVELLIRGRISGIFFDAPQT